MVIDRKSLALAGTAIVLALPTAGLAATHSASLTPLNGSGVSGSVLFDVDETAQTLRVDAKVSGLAADQVHLNHIHGAFDGGAPSNSEVPTTALDADGDGFVEVLEAAPAYGDILLSLESSLAGDAPDPSMVHTGPVADANGNLSYSLTFDLTDESIFFSPVLGNDYTSADLFPLDLREYVIHGLFVPGGVSDDLPDGGYLATLPVAAAEIELLAPVPLPAGGLLLLGGLGTFGAVRRLRRG